MYSKTIYITHLIFLGYTVQSFYKAHVFGSIHTYVTHPVSYRCEQDKGSIFMPSYGRDNYNSLTSAKLPPKNEDGQLKSICVDKRADKINILIEKIICIIKTMAALEVMSTLHPRVVVKSG